MGNVEEARLGEADFVEFCNCLINALLCPRLGVTRHRTVVYNIPLGVEMSKEEFVVSSAFT